jgi:hypothetical protein
VINEEKRETSQGELPLQPTTAKWTCAGAGIATRRGHCEVEYHRERSLRSPPQATRSDSFLY